MKYTAIKSLISTSLFRGRSVKLGLKICVSSFTPVSIKGKPAHTTTDSSWEILQMAFDFIRFVGNRRKELKILNSPFVLL